MDMPSLPVLHDGKREDIEEVESDWFGALAEDPLASSAQADFVHPDAGMTATPFATVSPQYDPEPPLVRFGSPSS